jgi:hypothetical protein
VDKLNQIKSFSGRHHNLLNRYRISVLQRICSVCRKYTPVISLFLTYDRVCNRRNTTGTAWGAETAYHSGAHEFTPGLSGVRDSLVFCVVFYRSLHVLFLLAIVLSVIRFIGIFKHYLSKRSKQLSVLL